MKLYYISLFLMLFIITLVSCEGNKIDPSILSREIKVNATIIRSDERMVNDLWLSGDEVGIYMVKANSTLSKANILHSNERYITSGDGNFVPATDAIDIKFPEDGGKVNFISYYPYKKSISSNIEYPIDVSNQEDQGAIDLLYSDNAIGLSRLSPAVNMEYFHKLSKIKLNISVIDGSPLKNVRATLKGVDTKGKFSLIDKSITSSSKGNIKIKVNEAGNAGEAIVIPTSSLSGVVLEVVNGNIAYECSLGQLVNVKSFDSGCKYDFKLKLDPENMTVSVVVNPFSTINSWEELPSEEIVIGNGNEIKDDEDGENNVNGVGSENNPYSIKEAINNIGASKVWVRGYIVGYYTGTSVKSFSNDLLFSNIIKETSLALASSPEEVNGENTFPIFLSPGEMRDALNLNDNRNLIGREVAVKGNIANYYGSIGLKETFDYRFVD